ncbi:MAG: hypothetical protein K2J83_07695 [Clostridia bacterium]|nr:hypothetical protein [Clostridia bacterium]
MQYADYRKKMIKLAGVLSVLKRFRVLIISACVIVVALITTLLCVRGIVYEVSACPQTIVYGEALGFRAKAVMGSVVYEYAEADGEEWSQVEPVRAGSYKVRPCSKSVTGQPRYGKVNAFTILPKSIEVRAEDYTVYGDNPDLVADLSFDDSITCSVFTYDDKYAETTEVLPDKDSVVITDKNGADVTSSYIITTVKSEISIGKRTLTVAAASAEKEYDGTSLTADGYELKNCSLAFGDKIRLEGCKGSLTNAGSAKNEIVGEVRIYNENNADVTDRYELSKTVGTLTVNKRKITVASADAEKEYDGEEMTCLDFTDDGRLLSGHTLSVSSYVGITDAGERENTLGFTVIGQGGDLTSNYEITLEAGVLKISPRKITVTMQDKSWVYGGVAYSWNGHDVTAGSLVDGHSSTAYNLTLITDVGTAENLGDIRVLDGTKDVTANYSVTVNCGTLRVTAAALEIYSDDYGWVYDGSAHGWNGYTQVGLAEMHTITPTSLSTITDVGTCDNEIEVKIFNGTTEVTENYSISYHWGTLEITARAVTVTADSAEKVYDGTALACNTVSADNLVTGHRAEAKVSGTGTDAGEYANVITEGTVVIRGADGKDVTSNYDITLSEGTLKVLPRPITVITADHEWIYDGNTHYDSGYKIGSAADFALVAGHTAVLQSRTDICGAGNEENVLIIKIFSGAKDVTSNYGITYDNGTLTVKPRPVTVTTGGGTKVYDGTALTAERYGLTSTLSPAFVSDHYEEITFTGAQTDVGTGKNTVQVRILSSDGEVTENYAVTVIEGSLTVTKRPVTVISLGGEWVYDGNAHRRTALEISEEKGMGLAVGQAAQIVTQSAITNVGTTKNVITVQITEGSKDTTANYDITYEYGTLKVTPRPVTITAGSSEKQYDGTPLVCGTVGGDNLVLGHTVTARTTGSQINVGESANRIVSGTVFIADRTGSDATKNYTITLADGVLKVIPREIIVKAGNASKVYDGDPLTCELYSVVSTTPLLSGHKLTAQTSGSLTDAGKGENLIVPESVRITSGGSDVSANYSVTLEGGTLTVEKRQITVTAGSAEKEYDGEELTCGEYTITSRYDPALVKDHKLTATVSGSRTDAGEGANVIENVEITSASGDVTANYAITAINGTLTVTGKKLTVTSADGEWVYDGEWHYNEEFEYDGLLEGHTIECNQHYYICNVDSYENIIAVKVYSDERDVTRNYQIEYTYGTLTVTERDVYLTTADGEWVYDGSEHSALYAEVNSDSTYGLVDGHTLDYADGAMITYVGKTANDIIVSVFDGENDVTANYDLHLTFGTLEVKKRPVTITYKRNEIYFTGAPVNEVITSEYLRSVSDYPLLDGEIVYVTALCDEYGLGGANLYFGEGSAGVCDRTGKDLTANYEITLLSKRVQIVQRKILIQSATVEKVYDGTPLICEDYEIISEESASAFVSKCLVQGHTLAGLEITFTGSITEIGESYNYFTVDSFKVVDDAGKDVTYGYETETVFGNMYVTEFGSLHVTTSGATKIYDGTPLTCRDYTVESTLLDGYEYFILVTGSQTEVGSSDNTIEVFVISPDGKDVSSGLKLFERLGTLTVIDTGNDWGGRGDGDIDTSGGIGGGGGADGQSVVALKVYSEASGVVYMRLQSYGNYTGKGWNPANPYTETVDGTCGMNYLTGYALAGAGRSGVYMQVDVAGNYYYLPYYLAAGNYNYRIQSSDVLYSGDTGAVYSLYYYPYDYLSEGAVMLNSEALSKTELLYRQFVYENYLAVPNTTAQYLKTVIAAQGFDLSDGNLIAKIAAFVQGSATYNLNYDTNLDGERDAVVSFLRDYKEGVCRHYASAATLLYRMMGIPARYTIGYKGNTVAGNWVEITSGEAHAWVEVYIDGEGWVQIEVTGTDDSSYGEIDLGTLTPVDVTKEYDGTPLVANRLIEEGKLAELLAQGFTYKAQFGGSQTYVGTGGSYVTDITLYGPDGKPILKGVKWMSGRGKLTVVGVGSLITVHLYYLECEYDGRGHSLGSGDWYAEGLPAGFRIEFDPSSIVVTEANGFDWESLKNLPLRLYNSYGYDVTANYNIIFSNESVAGCDGEGICVTGRRLTICTQTAEKEYDGKPLTNSGWWISFGTLAEGHKIEVKVSGAITDVGEAPNTVSNLRIFDEDGRDVTKNYKTEYVFGKLSVID